MKIFIVGAAGYIGFYIATKFRQKGYEVYGLTRSAEKAKQLEKNEIIPVIGNMQDTNSYLSTMKRCSVMIHAAADYANDQFGMDKKVIKAWFDSAKKSAERKTLIYTSGMWVYGNACNQIIDELTPLNPSANVKGREKIEDLVMSEKNVRTMIIRPTLVYGKQGALTSIWFNDAATRRSIRVVGNGNNRYPTVHVEDLSQVYLLALESALDKEVFNIAEDAHFTVNNMVDATATLLNIEGKIEYLSTEQAQAYVGGMAEPLTFDLVVSSQKAKRLLGWQAKRRGFIAEIEKYYASWNAWKQD